MNTANALEAALDALFVEWLHPRIDDALPECRARVLVVCGCKNEGGCSWLLRRFAHEIDSGIGLTAELNVDERHINAEPAIQRALGLGSQADCANYLDIATVQ